MLQWKRHRDDITCEVYHTLYNEMLKSDVVIINKVGPRYRVKILDHMPFHCGTLTVAKRNGQHVYENSVPV